MMKSAPTLLSICALADVTIDAAMMHIVVVSAMPIISADAVAAVRRGLRRAFSRASRPGHAPHAGQQLADAADDRPAQQRRQGDHAAEHRQRAEPDLPGGAVT